MLEFVVTPDERTNAPAEQLREAQALSALGATTERETMRCHPVPARTEVWTFYRIRFGADVESAAHATRALLTEAYRITSADQVAIETKGP
jgi:hypothetical protein